MVGNCHPLLASAKEAAGRTQKNMTPRTSHKGEKQNHALEECIAAAKRGWMCFFLTSPFIEPAKRAAIISFPNQASVPTDRPEAVTVMVRCSIL
jgi:hypothetical protein